MLPKLILASQSPRRKQILESLGLPFEVKVKQTDEAHPTILDIEQVIQANALAKVKAVVDGLSGDYIVIGADTLVALNGEVLGKPTSKEEASRMLEKLSGQTQTVYTGLVVSRVGGKALQSVVRSQVVFHSLTDEQIAAYTETHEPYDKAGSYAVQGLGALFIEKIIGSYTNVMGLPIEQLLVDLGKVAGVSPHQWFLGTPR